MKIGMLTSVHSVFDGRIFFKQAKTLVGAGHRVVVIGPHDKQETRDGILIIPVKKPRSRLLRIFLTWQVFVKARQQACDCYEFHDLELILVGLLIKYVLGKKVVYDVHEYYHRSILSKYWIPCFLRFPLSQIVNYLEKALAAKFDAIITVNDHMKEIFKKRNTVVISVYNYPLNEYFANIKQAVQPNPVIIYLGNMDINKGLLTLLQAMPQVIKEHPRASCLILGDVNTTDLPQYYLSNLPEFLAKSRITFLARRPMSEIAQMVSAAAIGWIPWVDNPNNRTGTPTKLFEYMACGKPTIASQLGFITDIINKSQAGIVVEPENPTAHAVAINQLLADKNECARLGNNGRQAFLNRFNWEHEGQKLIKLYQQLEESEYEKKI